jgi:hypothetical protein
MRRCRRCRRLRTSQERRGTRPTAAARSVSTRLWRSTGTPSFPERIRSLQSLTDQTKTQQWFLGYDAILPCRCLRRSFNRILRQSVTSFPISFCLFFCSWHCMCRTNLEMELADAPCYGCRCQKGKKDYVHMPNIYRLSYFVLFYVIMGSWKLLCPHKYND